MARSSRSPRVTPSGPNRHFFKVFFPELYSEHLRIPPMFRKHIEGEGPPNTVSLKGPSGSIWYVDLVKNSNVLSLENGWKEFVHDHSLRLGDFLVFRYEGNLHFTVFVFDDTACEKDVAFSARPCQDDITVLDGSADGGRVGEEASRPLVVSRNGNVPVTPKTKRGSDDCHMLEVPVTPKTKRGSDDCHMLEVPVTMKRKRGSDDLEGPTRKKLSRCKKSQDRCKMRPHCGRLRSRALRKNPISSNRYIELVDKAKLKSRSRQVAKACPQSRTSTLRSSSSEKLNYSIKTNASMLPCKIPSKTLPFIKSSQVPRPGKGIGRLKSQRRPITLEELHMTAEKAKAFKSTNPFFMVKMQNSYVYSGSCMYIHRRFWRDLPKDSRRLTLWDPNGKSWEVKYVPCGGLSAGWIKFSYTNNLESGDVCVFEAIKEDQMRVHIFRVVEELTPLIPISRGRS